MTMDYRDATLDPKLRAADLVRRMTVREKLAQLQCYNPKDRNAPNLENAFPYGVGSVSLLVAAWDDSWQAAAARLRGYQEQIMARSRFGIPAIFHIEGVTGALMPGATSFPVDAGRGSAWDPELEERMGRVVAREAVAVGIRHVFAPVLDVTVDARMGRCGESYSEDATLAGAVGASYVRGIQADGNTIAAAKHFVGYHAAQGGIHGATCHVTERELRERFCKPFQAAINDADLRSLMNQYGDIDGEPVAASARLLQDLLRREMGFDGLLVTDYASVMELVTRTQVCATPLEAGELALKNGFHMELPTPYAYAEDLAVAIEHGEADGGQLDRLAAAVLEEKFCLGLFECPFPTSAETAAISLRDRNARDASLAYARESLVLLKNDGTLPLEPVGMKIAVIGHNAASTRSLFGGYSYMSVVEMAMGGRNTMAGIAVQPESEGLWRNTDKPTYPGSDIDVEIPRMEQVASTVYEDCRNLFEELSSRLVGAEVTYAYGFPYVGDDESGHEEALALADASDLSIVVVGGKAGWGTSCSTGEGIDSASINLPPCQERFLEKLAARGDKFVVVHLDARPISSDAADAHAAAILEAWCPAEYGAQAIAETLLGENNPSGHLPVTVAYSSAQAPVRYDHGRGSSYTVGTDSAFKSYIDMSHEPRYRFGHGLSYTSFEVDDLVLERDEVGPFEPVRASFAVTNVGAVAGVAVVQAYARDLVSTVIRPVQELVGFTRVPLVPGEFARVELELEPSQLAFLDRLMRWKIEAGEFELMVGLSSSDIRQRAAYRVRGDAFIEGRERALRAPMRLA